MSILTPKEKKRLDKINPYVTGVPKSKRIKPKKSQAELDAEWRKERERQKGRRKKRVPWGSSEVNLRKRKPRKKK